MRMALVILSLAAIAVALVHIRRAETSLRNEVLKLEAQQVKLRRTLWDQQMRLACMANPEAVKQRAAAMSLDLIDRNEAARQLAEAAGGSATQPARPSGPARRTGRTP